MPAPRRFGPIPPEEMTSAAQAVADAILAGPRAMSTGLRGPFEALLRSPGLADPAQRLGAHIRFASSIPAHLNEMAILLTARRWSAQFEWHAHRELALAAGLDPEIADAIAVGSRPAMDADTASVFDFASALLTIGDVEDELFAGVEQRWGKQGAIDLIGAVGYYTLVSFILNVDRYPVPGGEAPLGPLRESRP